MAEELRGECQICGRAVQLKKDGTIRHHSARFARYAGAPNRGTCEGSGCWPEGHRYAAQAESGGSTDD